jgi:hypothetical protein
MALCRAFGLLTAVCLFVGTAASCGGSSGGQESSGAAQTVVVTQTVVEASDVAEEEAISGSTVLPDVVGERLDVAESDLDDLGIDYEAIGGGTFGVVVASNWTVCDQRPTAAEEASSVKLIIARPGDCDSSTQQQSGGGSDEAIPDLVGERLDVAESELEDLGIAYEEIGGGTFGAIDESAWEVCKTRPAAGEPAQVVKLIVDRPGEC